MAMRKRFQPLIKIMSYIFNSCFKIRSVSSLPLEKSDSKSSNIVFSDYHFSNC